MIINAIMLLVFCAIMSGIGLYAIFNAPSLECQNDWIYFGIFAFMALVGLIGGSAIIWKLSKHGE